MKSLNLVMIVKNEEKNLSRCLKSCVDIVNEIIIVDTGSTDDTKKIAKSFNAKIYDYKWNDNFSNARNFALKKSNSDFNLILDADEYITKINYNSLQKFMNLNNNHIAKIKISNLFNQDNEIKKSNSFISRIAPKGALYYGSIHEQLDNKYPRVLVDMEIEHDGYVYVNKSERNIKLILNELENNSSDTYMLYQAAKTYYTNKEFSKASHYFDNFYKSTNYNIDNFYTDGVLLFIYNCIKTKDFEKGLSIINDNIDILNNRCDFYFACGIFFTEIVAYDFKKYGYLFNNIELSYINALNIGENNLFDGVEGTGSYLAAYNLGVYYKLINDIDNSKKYYSLSDTLRYKMLK